MMIAPVAAMARPMPSARVPAVLNASWECSSRSGLLWPASSMWASNSGGPAIDATTTMVTAIATSTPTWEISSRVVVSGWDGSLTGVPAELFGGAQRRRRTPWGVHLPAPIR